LKERKTHIYTILSYCVLITACVIVLYPILWVIASSFKSSGLVGSSLIPKNFTFENYMNIFRNENANFTRWFINSIVISTISAFMTLSIVMPASYACSRMNFRGKKFLLITFLTLQMFPAFMSAIALYTIFAWLRLVDTYLGLVIIYCANTVPFSLWIMKNYFDSIPFEIEESAFVDGATMFQSFTHILLPMARPIIYVVFLISFLGSYCEYLLANIILMSGKKWTLALGMRSLTVSQFSTNWPVFSAISVVSAVPIVILFFLSERYLTSGLTQGAIK